jgi:hypothetical protein
VIAAAPQAEGLRHPRNPWFGLLYAAILAAGAVGGAVALFYGWREALAGDMAGQRTEGFVLVTPFLSAAGSVFLLVRGIRALAPWVRHRSTTPRPDRLLALAHDRSNTATAVGVAFAVGILALAGFVLLAGFARPNNGLGFGLLLQMDALLLFVAILALKGGIQGAWANRYISDRRPG